MSATRVRRGEAGQAAVLAALTLFTMVVFLALATNTGSLVNERIRIQNAADLGAYAGSREQSQKMNNIAFLNTTIMEVATYCRQRLSQGTRLGPGIRDWNKIWNQCLPELPLPGMDEWDEPKFKLIKAFPPVHDLSIPPNRDTPPGLALGPRRYKATHECRNNGDSRADDLINWCERTIQYYGSVIYDINDHGSAYDGKPIEGFSSLLIQRPIRKAVALTVARNYPRPLTVELLDAPANSPVHKGRFMQEQLWLNPEVWDVKDAYERKGGPGMIPLKRYVMNFNYVYFCCSQKSMCSPAMCNTWGNQTIPDVGPHNDVIGLAQREIQTVFSKPPQGILFAPVRVSGNPRTHDVPLLDNPTKAPDSNYFGGWGAWNDLRAVAVAKPFDGFIGPSPDDFDDNQVNVPVVVPFARTPPRGIYVPSGLEDMKEDGLIPYATYRARVAGFREPLASPGAPVSRDNPAGSMIDVLIRHATMQPLPSDDDPSDYGHTSH